MVQLAERRVLYMQAIFQIPKATQSELEYTCTLSWLDVPAVAKALDTAAKASCIKIVRKIPYMQHEMKTKRSR